jgi:hypothetical protein
MLTIMQRFPFAILLLMIVPLSLSGVTIKTAYTRYYEDGEIRPIRQYFGGTLKLQGFRTVIASDPSTPEGQYFIAKLDDGKKGQANKVRMTLYSSDSKNATVHNWDLGGESLSGWLYLGLTGKDWPSDEVKPLAWRIEILNGETLLAEWKSFLWEMPG